MRCDTSRDGTASSTLSSFECSTLLECTLGSLSSFDTSPTLFSCLFFIHLLLVHLEFRILIFCVRVLVFFFIALFTAALLLFRFSRAGQRRQLTLGREQHMLSGRLARSNWLLCAYRQAVACRPCRCPLVLLGAALLACTTRAGCLAGTSAANICSLLERSRTFFQSVQCSGHT